MSIRPFFATSSFILTAGAIVFLFFIVLPGGVNKFPLSHFYWIEADTSKIPGAPSVARWTLYGYCEGVTGVNTNCTSAKAAYPFLPQQNFGTTEGINENFIQYRDTYYYLSRFSFASYLITLFFDVVALFLAFIAAGSRKAAGFASLSTFIALIFGFASAAISTALYVMARQYFNDSGETASLGVKMFAFTWAQAACQLFAFFGFCCACCTAHSHRNDTEAPPISSGSSFRRHNRNESVFSEKSVDANKKRGFFSVRRSAPPTNSFFAENESQERALNPTSSFERRP